MDPVERKKLNSEFIHMIADALTKGMDPKAADKAIYDELVNEMANSFTADSKEDEPINNVQNAANNETDNDDTIELYHTIFDNEKYTSIKEKMLLNVAYIINCFILENYENRIDNEYSKYNKIYYTIKDIYFKELCEINLTNEDHGILNVIIMQVLDMINCPWMPYYPVTRDTISKTVFDYNVAINDADSDRIINDIIHNSEDIIDRMKYLSLVFTLLFINKETINDYCDLDASRIISVSPFSYEYKEKLKYLTKILISYHTDYNIAIDRKCLSDAIQAENNDFETKE